MIIEFLFEAVVMQLVFWIKSLPVFNRLDAEKKRILSDNISFYNNLSPVKKRKFEYRVTRFIDRHEFIGREQLELNSFVLTLVSSSAIILTFNLNNYLFPHFKTILVYPKNFLSKRTNLMHKGETNPGLKAVVLSFESILEGIRIEDDNLHLGIHEFTHALYFSYARLNTFESFLFKKRCENILKLFTDKQQKEKLLNSGYLRDYAYENRHEFLAVITENYFETPNEFKSKLPELFVLVNKLYKIY